MHIERIVDLSRPIGPETVVYPGDPAVRLSPVATIERDGFNVLDVRLGSQSGTHVDAPYHCRADAASIDEVPLQRFIGPGVVIDVRGRRPREPIGPDALARYEADLMPGAIAVLHTGWAAHHGTDAYFDHPYLHSDACERLLARGVRTILIDAPSPDETPDDAHPGQGYPCHRLVAAAGGVIGENLCGLERIDWPDPLISVLPIRLEAADGAPVRAVALRITA